MGKLDPDGFGKKESERMDLGDFLEAHQRITGRILTEKYIIGGIERPDFICQDQKGKEIGIELSQVVGDYGNLQKCEVEASDYISGQTALELTLKTIKTKNKKRLEGKWHTKDTILVLQLMDYSFMYGDDWFENSFDYGEVPKNGFKEIWTGDYAILPIHSCIELFGIKPKKYIGRHEIPDYRAKPYG